MRGMSSHSVSRGCNQPQNESSGAGCADGMDRQGGHNKRICHTCSKPGHPYSSRLLGARKAAVDRGLGKLKL